MSGDHDETEWLGLDGLNEMKWNWMDKLGWDRMGWEGVGWGMEWDGVGEVRIGFENGTQTVRGFTQNPTRWEFGFHPATAF